MEVHQNKALSRIIQCFSFFLALRLLEELLIIPKYLNTKGVVASIGGFAILLFYIRFINKPLEEIGMIFSEHKIRKGVIIAAVINIIPAAIVLAVEYSRYCAKPGYATLSLFYDSVEHSYSAAGLGGFVMWSSIGLAIALIHAFFYEMTFRGLLISLGSRSLSFPAINLIQAGLYTFWYLIPVVRVLLFYSGAYSSKRILVLFISTLVYEMLTALKLGLLRASTGSVWVCIFDHVAFAYILDIVHVQYTSTSMSVSLDSSYYVRIIAYQVIALVLTFIYYVYKKNKITEMQRVIQMEQG